MEIIITYLHFHHNLNQFKQKEIFHLRILITITLIITIVLLTQQFQLVVIHIIENKIIRNKITIMIAIKKIRKINLLRN